MLNGVKKVAKDQWNGWYSSWQQRIGKWADALPAATVAKLDVQSCLSALRYDGPPYDHPQHTHTRPKHTRPKHTHAHPTQPTPCTAHTLHNPLPTPHSLHRTPCTPPPTPLHPTPGTPPPARHPRHATPGTPPPARHPRHPIPDTPPPLHPPSACTSRADSTCASTVGC